MRKGVEKDVKEDKGGSMEGRRMRDEEGEVEGWEERRRRRKDR